MADDNLAKIQVLLQKIKGEIKINEVHLSNKVEKTVFIQAIADLKEDYNKMHNKLLLKAAFIAGVIGGVTGLVF